ncbi:MAG: Fur family transcriptional regulator [bacterium]
MKKLNERKEEFGVTLQKFGFKLTEHRKAILAALRSRKGHHADAKEIFRGLSESKHNGSRIGLATVYRALEAFEKAGIVAKLSHDAASARYELLPGKAINHHHLICLHCGKVIEIDDDLTEGFKAAIDENHGFHVEGKPMEVFGLCAECSGRDSSLFCRAEEPKE